LLEDKIYSRNVNEDTSPDLIDEDAKK
jgi:hypothetical protein